MEKLLLDKKGYMDENQEIISLKFEKVMQARSYTVIVLAADEKKFAIYTEPGCGKSLQIYLTGTTKARPYTHDLMQMIFRGFDIRIKQVVINDLQDTIYFARLFLEQQIGDVLHIVEIDARPSDCINLALLSHAPLYCTKKVLERVVPIEE